MKKSDEIKSSTSCLNKAADDEPIFVLRGKDMVAPRVVEYWAQLASGVHETEKIDEALNLAEAMRIWRKHVNHG